MKEKIKSPCITSCPDHWIGDGKTCLQSDKNKGICSNPSVFDSYSEFERKEWAKSCNTKWTKCGHTLTTITESNGDADAPKQEGDTNMKTHVAFLNNFLTKMPQAFGENNWYVQNPPQLFENNDSKDKISINRGDIICYGGIDNKNKYNYTCKLANEDQETTCSHGEDSFFKYDPLESDDQKKICIKFKVRDDLNVELDKFNNKLLDKFNSAFNIEEAKITGVSSNITFKSDYFIEYDKDIDIMSSRFMNELTTKFEFPADLPLFNINEGSLGDGNINLNFESEQLNINSKWENHVMDIGIKPLGLSGIDNTINIKWDTKTNKTETSIDLSLDKSFPIKQKRV